MRIFDPISSQNNKQQKREEKNEYYSVFIKMSVSNFRLVGLYLDFIKNLGLSFAKSEFEKKNF